MQSPQIIGSVSSRCLGMSPRSPPKDGWAREVGLLSLTSATKCICLTAIHAVVHQIWQILCNEETLSRSLILSRVFSGYCGSLCSNLGQI